MRENRIKNNHNIHKNVYTSYLNKSTARLVNPDPKLMFGRIPIYLVWLLWRAAAVLNLQYFISRDFVLLWNLFYNKPLVQHVPESQGVERKVLHPEEK